MPFSLESNIGDDRVARITATWPVDVPEQNAVKGGPYPLDDVQEIWFTGRTNVADETPIFVKTKTGGGITAEGNIAKVVYDKHDLESFKPLTQSLSMKCDVQVKSVSGKIWTVADGTWKFKPEITRES